MDVLQPVEKILLMEEVAVFARASAADVSALAAIGREVRAAAGETLFKDGDAPAIYVLVTGELALEPLSGGTPLAAGPGDTIGVYETLSGADTTGWRAHVTQTAVALRIDREALFDLLADHMGLLQAMFSAVLRRNAGPQPPGTVIPLTVGATTGPSGPNAGRPFGRGPTSHLESAVTRRDPERPELRVRA